ncbi:MAG: YqgE/AlgH family protein [Hymenobacteraceae bacterium]|nr:YqgE/AlgH family protein [Hymenobacteraceae bacterium]
MTPGTLLLAKPFLGDPNFERTVVVVCRHDAEDGAFGLVLNRLTDLTLPDVLPAYAGPALPLGIGGPVQHNTLHYLHRLAELPDAILLSSPETTPPSEGVYWGGDYEVLLDWLAIGRADPADIRFFVGYSGWSGGQLEGEIATDTWVVRPSGAEKIFTFEPQELWRGVLLEMGGRYRVLANYPIDPSLN